MFELDQSAREKILRIVKPMVDAITHEFRSVTFCSNISEWFTVFWVRADVNIGAKKGLSML